MKSLFLLVVCILLLGFLKLAPVGAEKIERRDINSSEVIDFNGKLFVPQTIQTGEEKVNTNFVVLTVEGKKYRYIRKYNSFYLSGEAEEVPVVKGDKIVTTFPVTLFFARIVE